MGTYYVSPVYGLDTNGGQGADPTNASTTLRPWKSLAKAIGASAAIGGGTNNDIVYLCPGIYRETVSLGYTVPTTGSVRIIGDVANSQGFKDGSGNLLDGGEVRLSAYTAANTPDRVSPSSTALFNTNGRHFLRVENLVLDGGSASGGAAILATTFTHDVTWVNCAWSGGTTGTGARNVVSITGQVDTASNWLFDRCRSLVPNNQHVAITLPTTTGGADYNANITIRRHVALGGTGSGGAFVGVASSGANANKGGGVLVQYCTFFGGGTAIATSDANVSTTYPVRAYGNVIFAQNGTSFSAFSAGQIVEDNNVSLSSTTRNANITGANLGKNDVVDLTHALGLSYGQESVWGGAPVPFLAPLASPLGVSTRVGFGQDATYTAPVLDHAGRPSPAGGGSTTSNTTSGTATSATSTTLSDSGKSWTTNAYAGQMVKVTGGTGAGQRRFVVSNTATALTVDLAWTTTPDATSTYSVLHPGTEPAVGAFEAHDSGVKETTTVDAGASLKLLGPADDEFRVPVDTASTTFAVKLRYDNAHAATTKPEAWLLSNPEVGLTDATTTLNGAITNVATTLVVGSTSKFPTQGPFTIRIDQELLRVTATSSTTYTVTRGVDGTAGAAHSDAATITLVGVAEVKTMTAAADTWETLTFTAFTPTKKGDVTLRFVSHPAVGNGAAFVDTFSAT